ncbi:RNA polymerase sigma factor [Streptomyces sp. NPDC058595]|uniref:RNA polymerase sigma factor n=1 Tax=Streptomyces sp. NPDC058595 TaxID=3346550 RepID=UPI0036650DE8
MTMLSEWPVNAQVIGLVRAGLAEEIERQEREDNEKGPEREPEARVRLVSVARPEDDELRALLDGWFREYAPMVRRVVARNVFRHDDEHLVDDLAQDVWVEAWQYLLRGNEVRKPHGLLALMARTRVCRHYQSARVRREAVADLQDYERAVDRLASWIGAAA